jgi:hypothetical protein
VAVSDGEARWRSSDVGGRGGAPSDGGVVWQRRAGEDRVEEIWRRRWGLLDVVLLLGCHWVVVGL